ncbi:MAG: hypothetical protein U0570_10815 [Phycisphaerales bacterium]
MRCRLCFALVVFLLSAIHGERCFAQCDPQWLPGDGFIGVDGSVNAVLMWDPDSAGPLAPRLVVGGNFSLGTTAIVGNSATQSYVAMLDPDTGRWVPLGTELREVRALAVLPDGTLVAGGGFTTADGQPAGRVAAWDGATWSQLGEGFDFAVRCLLVRADGSLIAGGEFTKAGSTNVARIASWNGSAWTPLGSGMTGPVSALTSLPNGELIAGGNFAFASSVRVNNVARFDGSKWNALGSGLALIPSSNAVQSLCVLPDGRLLAGGRFAFTNGGAQVNFAAWDGATWSAFASVDGAVTAMRVMSNGELAVAGSFSQVDGVSAPRLALWNGLSWRGTNTVFSAGIFVGNVNALVEAPGGDLLACGSFYRAGSVVADSVARWNGSAWTAVGAPIAGLNEGSHENSPEVNCVLKLEDGRLLVGGDFRTAGSSAAGRAAIWNGISWTPLGMGMNSTVHGLGVLPDGGFVAGGEFTTADGGSAQHVARWDGDSWSPLGDGTNANVYAVAVLHNGDIVAGGEFTQAGGMDANSIARWDGQSWKPLGEGLTRESFAGGRVSSLVVMPNGDLVAAGDFGKSGATFVGGVARWNGSAWSGVRGGSVSPQASFNHLTVDSDGNILLTGSYLESGFSKRGAIRWDGTAWSVLIANTEVRGILPMPNGDVIFGNQTSGLILRWNGSSATALGSGVQVTGGASKAIDGLSLLPNGEVLVFGVFDLAGGVASRALARWTERPVPQVAIHPADTSAPLRGTLSVSAAVMNGYSDVSFQWLRDGIAVHDGPSGVSPAGGSVSGASGTLLSPTINGVVTLSIADARLSDIGRYSIRFSNSCGRTDSKSAVALVENPCPADLDDNSMVNDMDFNLFASEYDMYFCDDPAMPLGCPADFNHDGLVDDFDFVMFNDAYNIGLCQ